MDSRNRTHERAGWLAAPALLLAVGLGAWVVRAGPMGLFGAVLGGMVAVPIVWITVSALWPATADRRCPRCGGEDLERIDPGSTAGVACRGCGFRDEARSAWLLAEEEGPLEDIVLRQRSRRRSRRSDVDTRSAAP